MNRSRTYLVTGAAGFIGSNLVDRLLASGARVVGVDNLSTGREEFLFKAKPSPNFRFHQVDLLATGALDGILNEEIDAVFHLSANADIRFGTEAPTRDLEQNVLVTSRVLEAMRRSGTRRIVFSSTGSVYGEAVQVPTPEDCAFPVQTSLYGASKLAAEGLVCAYCEGYGFSATVFRFVSVLGPRYTHGHVFDFVKQLRKDPTQLNVLGDGTQTKSYLHVSDCVAALVREVETEPDSRAHFYNLGTDEVLTVSESVALICGEMSCSPKIYYSGGKRGWIGDNPLIFLDTKRIRARGWAPEWKISDSVRDTVQFLLAHPHLFESRGCT